MCHLHPNDCHCEQCPCPGLTAAGPYPFVDPYREQHLHRGLSNLGPGNYWAAPPLDPRVAARQAGKGVDVSVPKGFRIKSVHEDEWTQYVYQFSSPFPGAFSWNGVRESAHHFAALPPEGGGHGLAAVAAVRPLRSAPSEVSVRSRGLELAGAAGESRGRGLSPRVPQAAPGGPRHCLTLETSPAVGGPAGQTGGKVRVSLHAVHELRTHSRSRQDYERCR